MTSRLKSTTARPSVFSLEGINPLVVGGHWIPDLLQMSGGNVASLEPGCDARRLEWEEVLGAAPERLLVDLCSSDVGRHLREVPWLAAQPAGRKFRPWHPERCTSLTTLISVVPGPGLWWAWKYWPSLRIRICSAAMIPPGAVVKLDPETAHGVPRGRIAECFRPFP